MVREGSIASLGATSRTLQAANPLQPGNSNRYATTANAKVGSTIAALLLVT
jgi:hypothetical protein